VTIRILTANVSKKSLFVKYDRFDIESDLSAQIDPRIEFPFVPDLAAETNPNIIPIDHAIEADHVGLNGLILAGERRAAADIGQRFEKTAPDFGPGVKNPWRQELVIGFEIECRESQAPAPANSPANDAVNAIGPPQHASGGHDIPRRQLFPDARAGNPFPVDHLRFHFHDFETETGRFALQTTEVTLPHPAEPKVPGNDQNLHPQATHEHPADEIGRFHDRQLAEIDEEGKIETLSGQPFLPLPVGLDPPDPLPEEGLGMGGKGQQDGTKLLLFGPGAEDLDDLLMSEMKTVKITDGYGAVFSDIIQSGQQKHKSTFYRSIWNIF